VSSPLTENNRRAIVRKWYGGENRKEIARAFGISDRTLVHVVRDHEARIQMSIASGFAPWLRARGSVE